jgi:hypothetical protein
MYTFFYYEPTLLAPPPLPSSEYWNSYLDGKHKQEGHDGDDTISPTSTANVDRLVVVLVAAFSPSETVFSYSGGNLRQNGFWT